MLSVSVVYERRAPVTGQNNVSYCKFCTSYRARESTLRESLKLISLKNRNGVNIKETLQSM